MSEKKIIAVLGATGAQGGGLVRAILDDPDGGYAARAITRNPTSEKAEALAAAGVEVVRADLDDPSTLTEAFEGAHGVYGVTNFWEHFSPEKETAQGANIARAAANAGVTHAIWSTFEDTRKYVPLDSDQMPTLMGKYKVPHFDSKADANHFFTDAGVPTTFLHTSGYWENLIHFGWGPQRGEDGSLNLVMAIGDAKMPGIAAGDIGGVAYGVFKRGEELVGRVVGAAGEHLSGEEMAAQTSEALGIEIGFWAAPPEVYRSFDFPGAEDVGNMFQFKRDFEDVYRGNRNLDLARELHPGLTSYKDWLAENGSRIPIPD